MLQPEQIHIGGTYRFRTLPRSIFAPSDGVALIVGKEWTQSHGDVFHIKLQDGDKWIPADRAYGCVSLYDVEFSDA